jgi:hypothetical protein
MRYRGDGKHDPGCRSVKNDQSGDHEQDATA